MKWGICLWKIMHDISFEYPLFPSPSEKKSHEFFYTNLKNVIPCLICRKHYVKLLKNFSIKNYLTNKYSLIFWVFTAHNIVNKRLKKKIYNIKNLVLKYFPNYDDIDLVSNFILQLKKFI